MIGIVGGEAVSGGTVRQLIPQRCDVGEAALSGGLVDQEAFISW